MEETAKKLLRRDLNRVLSKSGIELGEDLLKRTPDDILKFASNELTNRIVSNEIKKNSGLSVGIGNMRKTNTGDKMQVGVATADFVKTKYQW